MPPSLIRSVADSIDAPVAAMPWIAEVFQGLSALGSRPRLVARWLADIGLGPRHTVADLGCGKGAVAVEVASRIGCRVTGIDAFAPFIDAARRLSERRGVDDRCRFMVADVRRPIPRRARFDLAMMIGLFDLEEGISLLRPLVRPGGWYLIDDCVSMGRAPIADDAPLTRSEARLLIQESGDRVEREMVWTPAQVRRTEARLFDEMNRRARAIGRREPAARGPLRALLARQRREAADLAGAIRPAMWLVRKRSGTGRPPHGAAGR